MSNKYSQLYNLTHEQLQQQVEQEKKRLESIYGDEVIEETPEQEQLTHAKKFKQLCENIRTRTVETNRDTVIANTGEEGEGKTHWSVRLAMGIQPDFDIKKQMLFDPTPKEFYDLVFHELDKGDVIIFDEANRILNKRKFQSRGNIGVTDAMTVMRKQNKVLIMNMPKMDMFDSIPRNHRIYLNFNIPARGIACEFAKFSSPFTNVDPWFLEENNDRIQKACRGKPFLSFSPRQRLKMMKKCKGFMGYYLFNALPKRIEEEVDRLSMETQEKMSFEEQESNRDEIHKREKALEHTSVLLAQALRDQGLTLAEVAKIGGISVSALQNWVKKVGGNPKKEDSGFAGGKKVKD